MSNSVLFKLSLNGLLYKLFCEIVFYFKIYNPKYYLKFFNKNCISCNYVKNIALKDMLEQNLCIRHYILFVRKKL